MLRWDPKVTIPSVNRYRIAFAHANGYPPGAYGVFLAALREQAVVEAISAPFLQTPPELHASKRWPFMLAQLQQHLQEHPAQILVGHSMGGYLALQAAVPHQQVAAVVLIDSPIPTGWRSGLLTFAKRTGLSYRAGPAPIAARRREYWPSLDEARTHFQSKAFIQRWAPGVLEDFLAHGLKAEHQGGYRLTVPRAVERDIYAHIAHAQAHTALRQLKRRGVPVHFVAGEASEEVRLAGRRANQRLFAPHWWELPTGHLVPMEAPQPCASLIADILQGL